MKPEKRYFFRIAGIFLGGLTLVLTSIASSFPEQVETWYSRGVFPLVRYLLDPLVVFSSFPLFYLLFFLVISTFLLLIYQGWVHRVSRINGVLKITGNLMAFAGVMLFFFQGLWGLNYQRVPFEKQAGLMLNQPDSLRMEQLLGYCTHQVDSLRMAITGSDTSPIGALLSPSHVDSLVQKEVNMVMSHLGLPVYAKLPTRVLKPSGLLLRLSTAGFYLPYTGESNMDAGLHPLQIPVVLAHELGHAHGFGDEGVCNLIGFAATIASPDVFIQYAGWLSLWRHLLWDFRQAFPSRYKTIYPDLPSGPLADVDAIRQKMSQYPDFMPAIRNFLYQSYLQSQGVREGLKSYNRLVILADGWLRLTGKMPESPRNNPPMPKEKSGVSTR